jgi:hypothetical protein
MSIRRKRDGLRQRAIAGHDALDAVRSALGMCAVFDDTVNVAARLQDKATAV